MKIQYGLQDESGFGSDQIKRNASAVGFKV
jgi:hypothetical protein